MAFAQSRIVTCPYTPIDGVTVKGTSGLFDFDMPNDWNRGQFEQRCSILLSERPAVVPVSPRDPATALVRVPAQCPSPEFPKDQVVHLVEDVLGDYLGEVVAPSPND